MSGLRRPNLLVARPAAVGICVGLVLLLPLLSFATQGISIVGLQEESTGYRYFFSLRLLYGNNDRPWLPQGQIIGLVHMAIQAVLTLVGFPITQLLPRIDVFAYIASALPLIASAVGFTWAIAAIRAGWARLALAAAFICIWFDPSSGAFDALSKPDYLPWAGLAATIAIGWTLRARSRQPGWLMIVGVGAFAGLTMAAKPTWAIFALPVAAQTVTRIPCRARQAWASAVIIGVTPVVYLSVICLYYLGTLPAIEDHFQELGAFGLTAGTSDAPASFFLPNLNSLPASGVADALVLLAALWFVAARRRGYVLGVAMALGLVAEWWVVYHRYTPPSLFELTLYSLVVAVVLISLAGASWPAQRLVAPMVVIGCCVAALSVFWVVNLVLASYRQANDGQRQVEELLHNPGRTLVLIPDNDHRPLTIDSAIYKGSSRGLGVDRATVGNSPLVASIVPDRTYALATGPVYNDAPVNVAPYERLMFVSLPNDGGEAATEQHMVNVFGVATEQFDCSRAVIVSDQHIIVCTRLRAQLSDTSQSAVAVVSREQVRANAPVISAAGVMTTIGDSGGLAYQPQSRDLLRLREDGRFETLSGIEGQHVTLANVGAWDTATMRLSGTVLTFTRGRWELDRPPALVPVNINSDFGVGGAGEPVGWTIQPTTTDYTLSRDSDEIGPYTRLTAEAPIGMLKLSGGAPLAAFSARVAPVRVTAQVRAHGGGGLRLAVTGIDGDGHRVERTTAVPAPTNWTPLEVSFDPLQLDQLGNPELVVTDLVAGDWLDVRELVVRLGSAVPVNQNTDMLGAVGGNAPPNWQALPDTADYALAAMHDATGDFVRITALQPTAFISLQQVGPLDGGGLPLRATGQIRAHGAGPAMLVLSEGESSADSTPNVYTTPAEADERWHTISTQDDGLHTPSAADYVSFALVNVAAGDWFDVRQLGVWRGTLEALNANPTLEAVQPGGLPPGWRVGAVGARLDWLEDESGRFVRVTPAGTVQDVVLYAADLSDIAASTPVSVQAQIRYRSGSIVLAAHRSDSDPTQTAAQADGDGTWRTLVLRVAADPAGGPTTVWLGTYQLQPGDWFDIREVSVFRGIVP